MCAMCAPNGKHKEEGGGRGHQRMCWKKQAIINCQRKNLSSMCRLTCAASRGTHHSTCVAIICTACGDCQGIDGNGIWLQPRPLELQKEKFCPGSVPAGRTSPEGCVTEGQVRHDAEPGKRVKHLERLLPVMALVQPADELGDARQ
jgi:hypothetical protein